MSNSGVSDPKGDAQLLKKYPPMHPGVQQLWTAIVDVDAPIDLGPTAKGHRYMVPILGGRFYAGDVDPGLCGTVMAGGADRQLLRSDGAKELDAIYEMKTDAGIVLSIQNGVIVDQTRKPERYAMSVIKVTSPEGPHDWLNRRLIVGTLQSVRPDVSAVIIRAWLMNDEALNT